MIKRLTILIGCVFLLATTANALTFRQYKAAKDHPQSSTWQAVQAYLDGIKAGLDDANRELMMQTGN